jgi:hypothetical protein
MAYERSSPETETARRKERISMAREICLHRGENPNTVDRGGNEGWEKYEPLAGACIREAERLFSLRTSVHAKTPADPETVAKIFAFIWHGDAREWRGFLSKAEAFVTFPFESVSDTSTDREGK